MKLPTIVLKVVDVSQLVGRDETGPRRGRPVARVPPGARGAPVEGSLGSLLDVLVGLQVGPVRRVPLALVGSAVQHRVEALEIGTERV